jgi:hypothetical protein
MPTRREISHEKSAGVIGHSLHEVRIQNSTGRNPQNQYD